MVVRLYENCAFIFDTLWTLQGFDISGFFNSTISVRSDCKVQARPYLIFAIFNWGDPLKCALLLFQSKIEIALKLTTVPLRHQIHTCTVQLLCFQSISFWSAGILSCFSFAPSLGVALKSCCVTARIVSDGDCKIWGTSPRPLRKPVTQCGGQRILFDFFWYLHHVTVCFPLLNLIRMNSSLASSPYILILEYGCLSVSVRLSVSWKDPNG